MAQVIEKLKFLPFKIINEPWNEYKLEDGSTLRVKVVLAGLIKENGNEFSLQTTSVFGVIPNPKYIGVPSPPLRPGEKLESYIEAEDLKILEKTDLWNEYELSTENMKLSIKGEVVSVSRTSRHDQRGIPVYTANVQLLVKHKKKTK
jgi:hypothetical protein